MESAAFGILKQTLGSESQAASELCDACDHHVGPNLLQPFIQFTHWIDLGTTNTCLVVDTGNAAVIWQKSHTVDSGYQLVLSGSVPKQEEQRSYYLPL